MIVFDRRKLLIMVGSTSDPRSTKDSELLQHPNTNVVLVMLDEIIKY